jgi:hypothetical protein
MKALSVLIFRKIFRWIFSSLVLVLNQVFSYMNNKSAETNQDIESSTNKFIHKDTY